MNCWLTERVESRGILWILVPCAVVLCLAAWLRGAEYDEQYTLFLTSGVPRPDWPATVFPAGLAREIAGRAQRAWPPSRMICASPTCIRRCIFGWCRSGGGVLGSDLFMARLLSVVLGVGSLALIGVIARQAQVQSGVGDAFDGGMLRVHLHQRGGARLRAGAIAAFGRCRGTADRSALLAFRVGGGAVRCRDDEQLPGGVRGAARVWWPWRGIASVSVI